MDWEHTWAPYPAADYAYVLAQVQPHDIVLDIGAGDLRLAVPMAGRTKHVIAIELNSDVIERGRLQWGPLPLNLDVLCGDALHLAFPPITLGVLLMRHCTHFAEFVQRLQAAGCKKMITNARWGMGVETINLTKKPQMYYKIDMGWYACRCGATGFKTGPAERWTVEQDTNIHEVTGCPACHHT